MKKVTFLLILVACSLVSFGQSGKAITHTLADTGKYFTNYVNTGDFVYNQATGLEYVSKVDISVSARKKLSWLLASSSRYSAFFTTGLSGVTLAASGNGTIGGTLGVTGATSLTTLGVSGASTIHALSATSGTFSTTLGVTGVTTLTTFKGTGNDSITGNLVATGDLKAATGHVTTLTTTTGNITNINTTTDTVTNLVVTSPKITGTMTGNSNVRGSGSFTTSATRVAISIPGATSSDYYLVRGIAGDDHARPVAGDLLNCIAKTDSLIVMRAAGTTSGQGFTYLRIK